MNGRVEIHPRLVEDSVWRALQGRVEAADFHGERDSLYRIEDPEERESAFVAFHAAWFRRLEIDAPIRQTIEEQEDRFASVARCLIAPASSSRSQAGELFVSSAGSRSVVITILPEMLVDHDRALVFLRRELMHIGDMLDPAFEYEPRLPDQPAGPAHDRLLQDRYRILWNCSVDGRLLRQGRIPASLREDRRSEFARAFACLGILIPDCFDRIFHGPRPDHPALVAMASDPEALFGRLEAPPTPGRRCPLCAFPTVDFEPEPETLSGSILTTIRAEFPAWSPEDGLCLQCAELYRARGLSRAEAGRLPGTERASTASGP
jgi:hypothetical protein